MIISKTQMTAICRCTPGLGGEGIKPGRRGIEVLGWGDLADMDEVAMWGWEDKLQGREGGHLQAGWLLANQGEGSETVL